VLKIPLVRTGDISPGTFSGPGISPDRQKTEKVGHGDGRKTISDQLHGTKTNTGEGGLPLDVKDQCEKEEGQDSKHK